MITCASRAGISCSIFAASMEYCIKGGGRRELARILKNCHDPPGAELFKYIDETGRLRHISSEDVNRYLREITGRHITAKDFRTWAATNLALLEIAALPEARPTKRSAAVVVKRVAAQLGNTPAVCRKSYIHPRVLYSYL